jgi:hypothetical protein
LDRVRAHDLPDFDYWLLDDTLVAKLHFDAADRPLGAEIITALDTVKELAAALAVAENRAVTRDELTEACGLW